MNEPKFYRTCPNDVDKDECPHCQHGRYHNVVEVKAIPVTFDHNGEGGWYTTDRQSEKGSRDWKWWLDGTKGYLIVEEEK
jgi:hypothetical protein